MSWLWLLRQSWLIVITILLPTVTICDVINAKEGTVPKPDGMGLLLVEEGERVILDCDVMSRSNLAATGLVPLTATVNSLLLSPSGGTNTHLKNLASVRWHFNTLSNNALKSMNKQLTTNGSLVISNFNGRYDSGTYYCTVEHLQPQQPQQQQNHNQHSSSSQYTQHGTTGTNQPQNRQQSLIFGMSIVLTTRHYLPLLPVIERGPRDKIALRGDTVRFSCDISKHNYQQQQQHQSNSGFSDTTLSSISYNNKNKEKGSLQSDSYPKVTWYRDQLPIDELSASGGVDGSSGGGVGGGGSSKPHAILGSDLMLFYVDESSTGHYYCLVSNANFSVASQVASLSISSLGEKFRAAPAPLIEGIEGKRITLSCIAPVGNPEPKVSWLYEQKPIDLNSRPNMVATSQVTWDGVVKHELNMTNLRIEDEGQYSCLAANPLDRNINVTSAPSWLQIKTGPRFAHQMSDLIQYHSNSNLMIKCSAYASPDPPEIRFFFKGEQLRNSSRVRITESFRFHTAKDREFRLRESYLQISNISAVSDQGPYKCQALNSVNNITSLTRLEIIANPIQVSCTNNIVTTVGSDVTFECRIENKHSFPTPTTYWDTPKFGNVFPNELKNPRLTVFSNGTLRLKNVSLDDSGTFICYVLISSEVVQKTSTLVVKAMNSDPLPVIVLKPRDTTAYIGQNVTLPCEIEVPTSTPPFPNDYATGGFNNRQHYMSSSSSLYPINGALAGSFRTRTAPTIKWMKDLRVIYSSELKGIVLQSDGSLHVNNVNKQHEGKYTCVVSNGSGETVASATLLVTDEKQSPNKDGSTDVTTGLNDWDDFYFSSNPPSAPWVMEVVNSSCLRLAWMAPDHSDKIVELSYQVEKYGFGSNMWSWEAEKRLATGSKTGQVATDATRYTVCGLQLGVEYVFVVRGALSPGMTGRASAVSPRFKTYNYTHDSYHSDVEKRVNLMKQKRVAVTLTSVPLNTTAIWVSWKVTNGEQIPSGFQLRCFEFNPTRDRYMNTEMESAGHVTLPSNRRAHLFGNLRPSYKYKIIIQPHVVGLLGPISDYIITMTHYEVPSTPPSSVKVIKNLTQGYLTIEWDPPMNTPPSSLTGYQVTIYDALTNTVINSLYYDNSTNEVSIFGPNHNEDIYTGGWGGYRKIGVFLQAKSPAGFGPKSQPIIVDMFDGDDGSGIGGGGLFVPMGDRNWLILTLGGSIWVSLIILLGVLYFKFRRDKLTHSIQPYYIHAMHPSSKCSGTNEQLDQDIYPASINCHQHQHMAPLVIKTGHPNNPSATGSGAGGASAEMYSRSERNSLSAASTHYTQLGSAVFHPSLSATMPINPHTEITGSQILARPQFAPAINTSKMGSIAIFPAQRQSPRGATNSSPTTSPRSSAAFSALPNPNSNNIRVHPGGFPVGMNLGHVSPSTAAALYTSPTGSSAPGSLYAEVTDYQAYLPQAEHYGPCPQCNAGFDTAGNPIGGLESENTIDESNLCGAINDNETGEQTGTANAKKLPCTCPNKNGGGVLINSGGGGPIRYPPNVFPTMGLGGHTVAPGGVIISRVHPMQPQQRSVIGVATNGSYLKPAGQSVGGGSVASSAVGSSGCSSVGGGAGGDSSHDINGFLATTNDARLPVMYYANISNQPQHNNATSIQLPTHTMTPANSHNNNNKQHKQPHAHQTPTSTNTATDTNKLIKSHPGGQPGTEFEMTNLLNNYHNHQKSSTHTAAPGTIIAVPTYDIA